MSVKKIRVAVLYGGRSGEHEISLQSAASVVNNLDRNRFEVVPIGIDKQGRWFLNDVKQLVDQSVLPIQTSTHAALPSPCHLTTQLKNLPTANNGEGKFFDVVFPVMHGALCEDGTVQGMFELMDVPYVGAGVLGSALGMDKDASKRLVAAAGIAVAPYFTIKHGAWKNDPSYYCDLIAKQLQFPVFVKPANTGSSVGIQKVKKLDDLIYAIEDAFLYDVKVLVETAIDAREIELSALESLDYGAPTLISIPGEISPTHEFYSYAAKYLDEKGAELTIPAEITPAQAKQAQQLSAQIFELLDCEGMARVDLFLDRKTNQFYFNEINTIPGFTKISMYPKLWEASGLSYRNLLTHLIQLAIARHERKQDLKREWAVPK